MVPGQSESPPQPPAEVGLCTFLGCGALWHLVKTFTLFSPSTGV
jgi:hypothetical protein